MTTSTHPTLRAPRARRRPGGTYRKAITGRYRPLKTQQIAMAWWLYQAGHITRRQLRVYFAIHECAERRRYGRTADGTRTPHYRIEEIASLVGGRGSPAARRALVADVRHLAALRLVVLEDHAVHFAVSAEELVLDADLTGFWDFFRALPNRQRTVPVPRRTLRALAAGFGRAETGYILAVLLRSVFWDRGAGAYRVDGRTKGSWVAEVFGLSRRAVTDARARLIALGWLQPLDTPQWALNRYGVHDVVNVDWRPEEAASVVGEGGSGSAELSTEPVDASVDMSVDCRDGATGRTSGSASPLPRSETGSASPSTYGSTSSNLNTRTLRAPAPEPRGHRKRRGAVGQTSRKRVGPTIRDIRPDDLHDTDVLIALHRHAVEVGLAAKGPAGQLDFLALAHRARTRGRDPGAMLVWLLRHRKTEFITVADEEDATRRLREHLNGPDERDVGGGGEGPKLVPAPTPLCEDERVVQACLQVAKTRRGVEAHELARRTKGWDRERWDDAHLRYRAAQASRFVRLDDKLLDAHR